MSMALVMLLACKGADPAGQDTGLDLGQGPGTLTLPDLSDVDLPAAYLDGLERARGITLTSAWSGHTTAIARRTATCPDLYVGGVEDADMGDDTLGLTWSDYCQPASGGAAFGGWAWWDGSVQVQGDPAEATGQIVDASRSLSGDGLVSVDGAAAFELRGELSESIYLSTAPDYQAWSWSSLVDATVTGADAFPAAEADGWRASMYMDATGGEAPTLELRGAAYLFGPRIAGRFDSIDLDLSFGSDPDCTLEPHGWIALRDEDAIWYDLVFLPAQDQGETWDDQGLGACDGCGTLYVRGLETIEYGQVCPDLSGWAVRSDTLPDPDSFLLTLREILADTTETEGG